MYEIVENRFDTMHKMHSLNPSTCNHASNLSGCIERHLSKVIIALPTNNDIVETFEKTPTGGFSFINTRLGFDTEIFVPNHSQTDFNKMSIDEVFKTCKRQDLKVVYKLQLDNEKTYLDRRGISKILELDENNQYGYAMTKPLPIGCIKEQDKIPS